MLNMFNMKKFAGGLTLNSLKKIEMNNFFKYQFNKFQFAEVAKNEAAGKAKEEGVNTANFKPMEEFTAEDIQERIKEHRNEIYYNYGTQKRAQETKIFNKTEFVAKKLRQMWIRAGDLNNQKHVIPIKRLRTKDESMFKLLQQGEIAGVIEGREEFPDLNFVVEKRFIKRLDGMPLANAKPFYLKLGNEEIKCTFIKKDRLPTQNTPVKIRFQRFIEGRPNLLKLEIKLVGRHLQPLLQYMNVEIAQYYFHVDVWCKNEEYPPILEIDARLVSPDHPFKFLDLSLMLPEGMWLHRKYDRVMYNSIASMGENFNMVISSTQITAEDPDNAGEVNNDQTEFSDELKEMNDFLEKTQGSKDAKKKKALSMPLGAASSKKLMQVKNEGADAKALRKLMKTGGGDKKAAKKK